ncbi:hypothetical protein TNCV_853371 [Trichonephila clavipes]|nr:hypothetical protein TNCV_853371 [Trichonephila clavipes]
MIFIPLMCPVRILLMVVVTAQSRLSSGRHHFFQSQSQSRCFATAFTSRQVVLMGGGSIFQASVAREFACSFPFDVDMSGDPLDGTGFLPGNYGGYKLVDVLGESHFTSFNVPQSRFAV